MLPWLAAVLALYVGLILGGFTLEDPCDTADIPAPRETSTLEIDDWGFVTHCELTMRDGRVFDGTEVQWYPAVILISFGVGAWFIVAGLLGRVSGRRAVVWGLGCAAAFLVASLIWFSGFPDLGSGAFVFKLTRP